MEAKAKSLGAALKAFVKSQTAAGWSGAQIETASVVDQTAAASLPYISFIGFHVKNSQDFPAFFFFLFFLVLGSPPLWAVSARSMWSALFLKGWLGKCSDLAESWGPIFFFLLPFFLFVCLFFSFLVKGPVSRVGRISPRIHFFFCNTSQIIHAWLLSNQLFFPSIYGAGGPQQGPLYFFFPSPLFFSTAAQNGTPATDATLILYHSPAGLKVEMLNTGPFVMVGSLFPDFFLSPPSLLFCFFFGEPLLSVSDWESVASLGTLRSAVRNKYCDRDHLSRNPGPGCPSPFHHDETLMSFSVSQINHSILISERKQSSASSVLSTFGILGGNVGEKAAK